MHKNAAMYKKAGISVSTLLFLNILTVSAGLSQVDDNQKFYNFGVIPQFEQRKIFRIWRPILNQLEARTGYFFRLAGSQKIPVFENKLMSGQFDFAYTNPYQILAANQKLGVTPLVRDGGRELQGVLLVRKDSPIQALTELNHKEIAFPAPNALAASVLIRADLKRLFGLDISPRYVQTHTSGYLHVVLGQTLAAGGILATLGSQKKEIYDNLKILYKTRKIKPHPVSAHSRIPKDVQKKVQQAFLDMGSDEDARTLLANIPMKKVIAADMNDYTELRKWKLEEFYVAE